MTVHLHTETYRTDKGSVCCFASEPNSDEFEARVAFIAEGNTSRAIHIVGLTYSSGKEALKHALAYAETLYPHAQGETDF